jgi:VWFA-related protein
MKFRAVFASSLVLALCVGAAGQQPSAPNPTITFQTEVNYVDVDAVVTDEQGRFVGNLTKDDFEVREDGKLQKIEMFSTVDIPVERHDRFAPSVSDVRSNREAFAGRVYVIVLDDQNISPMRTDQTKKQAREFVQKYLGANDVAAVISTSGRTDAVQEFTNEPQLLLAAIDKFYGRRLRPATLDLADKYYQDRAEANALKSGSSTDDPNDNKDAAAASAAGLSSQTTIGPSNSLDFERSYRAFGVLRTLENVSDYLATVRGRRKAVLLFSEGIDYPTADLFGSSRISDVQGALQDVITAAARGDVNYFTIDPRGLVGMDSTFVEMASVSVEDSLAPGGNGAMNVPPEALLAEMRQSQDSLRTLADETGGFAAVNRNSVDGAFERIVTANSRYYVIGYYPPSHPRDGRFHKIDLRVKRPGLKVSARKGYPSPRGKTPEEKKRDEDARLARDNKKGGTNSTSAPLRDAMNGPMQLSGLPFTVQAAPFKGAGKDASVALAIELDGSSLQFAPQSDGTATDSIELSFFSLSDQGKPQPGVQTVLRLKLKPEGVQRVKSAGLRANPRISLPPGRYQIRIGAREAASDRLGTVFYDVTVPDFSKDPLMLSGLLLTARSDQAVTVQKDDVVATLLPGPATGKREFARTDTLALLSEIYDNSSSRQPRQIDVSVRLLSEAGQEAYVARDSVMNTADAKKWNIYAYTKQIPLGDIAAGRYLLRVQAQVRGTKDDANPAARETLITIK